MGLRGLSSEAASSAHTLLKTILDAGPAWALRAVLQAAGVGSKANTEEHTLPLTVGDLYMGRIGTKALTNPHSRFKPEAIGLYCQYPYMLLCRVLLQLQNF
jgi:hypothetical protein